ncbi:MAG: GNAT family N-acetyltransferase [Firmicutes bacterium]|nr:GNAT family N-acetyltransferase [Bacillota bacterium]
MQIHRHAGEPTEAVREFMNTHWPEANQELFGWSGQEHWRKRFTTVWLETDGVVVAVALFWKLGGVGHLSQLLVEKQRRNQGLGKRLLAAFEEGCRDCHKLTLKTYQNSDSQRFYEAAGYQVEAALKHDVHGIDWVLMYKWVE